MNSPQRQKTYLKKKVEQIRQALSPRRSPAKVRRAGPTPVATANQMGSPTQTENKAQALAMGTALQKKLDQQKPEQPPPEHETKAKCALKRRRSVDYEIPNRTAREKRNMDSPSSKKPEKKRRSGEKPPAKPIPIEQCTFYHFCLARKDAADILLSKASGSFLVRATKDHEWGFMFCVSVIRDGEIWHVKMNVDNKGHFYLTNSFHSPEVYDVIMHHMRNKVPVSSGASIAAQKTDLLLLYPIDRLDWEIMGNQISIEPKSLGEGEFGAVYKGTLQRGNNVVQVALKTLQDIEDDQAREDLLREGRLMRRLGKFETVVAFVGITVSTTATMLLIEYVNGGSFDNILKNEEVDNKTIGRILCDVARALVYLKQNSVVHRDIAARNILVSKQDAKLIRGKISDFGMSRYLVGENYRDTRVGRLPVRWSAPETLELKLWNFETDAWMFGITIWEAFNEATIPFYELEPMNLESLLKYLQAGARPTPMTSVPKELRQLLDEILDIDPKKRTPVSKIVDVLQSYYKKAGT